MTKEQSYPPTCIDCGTQNCKFKERTYPEFCLTTHLEQEDLEWALKQYNDNNKIWQPVPKWNMKVTAD